MTRTKSIRSRKSSKIRLASRGFKNARGKRIKTAKEALMHAGRYAYVGRKGNKRNFRRLWITRLGIASKALGVSYSKVIDALKKSKIEIDRKLLSDIAVKDSETFEKIVKETKLIK